MDKDRENLWARRNNASKLSLSTNENDNGHGAPSRTLSSTSKRFGESSHGRNPLNAFSPSTISTPHSAATAAFGLGSGAFSSFGSSKTPKTPGTAFDFKNTSSSSPTIERKESKASVGAGSAKTAAAPPVTAPTTEPHPAHPPTHPLKYGWMMWYRPPTSKNSDYEKSIKPICKMATVEDFWKVYVHLKRPSGLPTVSDYHFFRDSIRPVWEDEENKKGGKWIMRIKKAASNRLWENLLMSLIGNMYEGAGDEICGAVISVRSGEDVVSIWTKYDGGKNVKIRETLKRVLELPPDTIITWKSHDDSIAQRTAIDQARHENKRRGTINTDDSSTARGTGAEGNGRAA